MMLKRSLLDLHFTTLLFGTFALSTFGCGGAQSSGVPLETRGLEEIKALEIVDSTSAERGLSVEHDTLVSMPGVQPFSADARVVGRRIAIEFLTGQDRIDIGAIPPPAQGSKLHVLAGSAVAAVPGQPSAPVFVLFLDDRNFEYQPNPTSENRADITLAEVQSRLRRDLIDFFTWYDATQAPADAPQTGTAR